MDRASRMKLSRYNVWVEEDPSGWAVFNGMSGALVSVDRTQRTALEHFLENSITDGLDPELLRRLVEARIVIRDQADELAQIHARNSFARRDPRNLGLTLVSSLGCNFDCPYCFEDKRPSKMSNDVQDAVVRLLHDSMSGLENLDVTWMGGEPLIARDVIWRLSRLMMSECDANGVDMRATIVTNGWYLTDEVSQLLAEHRVTNAQVTIDGPPDIHDRARPFVGGGSTFWTIVDNLEHATKHLDVSVRVNVDSSNLHHVEELFKILVARGLAGRLNVSAAKLVNFDDNPATPMANYKNRCFTSPEFAEVSLEFEAMATSYGLTTPTLPSPKPAACTAVHSNAVVVGSEGELYSCWDHIGTVSEAFGHISSYWDPSSKLHRWLSHDPTKDAQCSTCIALPVCMGGCPHYGFVGSRADDKCGTFRFTYQQQVERFVAHRRGERIDQTSYPLILNSAENAKPLVEKTQISRVPTPVTISRRSSPMDVISA
jgi:uncharacterized protein